MSNLIMFHVDTDNLGLDVPRKTKRDSKVGLNFSIKSEQGFKC